MHPQQPYQPHSQQGSGQYPYPQQNGWPPTPGASPTNGYPQPTRQQVWPPAPPATVKQRRKAWPWIVGGLVTLILIMIVGAAGSKGTSVSTSTPSANAGSPPSAQVAAAAPAPQPAGPPKAITAREWAKIAKDPGSHVGEAVIVYGEVTQFDSTTGTSAFRASVDGVKHPVNYGFANYPTNTILTGDGVDLGDLVEGDLFQADAIVAGSISYENTMGGSLTAPKLTVSKVKVIGSTKH